MKGQNEPILTIFTPAYNRAHTIGRTYKSLCAQTCKDFIWLVVDDGSTDNTAELVKGWQGENNDFEIRYIYKKNGGKHTAINLGVKHIKSAFTFIVDSDDILTPNAVECVVNDIKEVIDDNSICGIGYLRGYDADTVIGDRYSGDRFFSDFITERINGSISGDKAEVWRTADMLAHPFPEHSGEKFVGEGYVWCSFALENKRMLFVNKILYITPEYLQGGLTQSGRKFRIENPLGGMDSANVMMNRRFNVKNKIKGALLYVAYGKFAGWNFSKIVNTAVSRFYATACYLPGMLIYRRWKKLL